MMIMVVSLMMLMWITVRVLHRGFIAVLNWLVHLIFGCGCGWKYNFIAAFTDHVIFFIKKIPKSYRDGRFTIRAEPWFRHFKTH
jgi:hypothetical protein